jgi:hypothetical protein
MFCDWDYDQSIAAESLDKAATLLLENIELMKKNDELQKRIHDLEHVADRVICLKDQESIDALHEVLKRNPRRILVNWQLVQRMTKKAS